MTRETATSKIDPDLFPASFLRLLSVVPSAVRRLHAGVADGQRAVRGEGGRFLFRGHRPYRPGDDPRRIDWRVHARLGRLVVRQFEPERDVLSEVWLDGSASLAPFGGRAASARAAALCCAIGLGGGGRIRLGLLHEGKPVSQVEAAEIGQMRLVLERLSQREPSGRAGLADALPQLVRRLPHGARFLLVSDLLTRADPGVLHALAGRGIRGAVLHLRAPEVYAPKPCGPRELRDVESDTRRTVALDEHAAARVARRAKAHADLWAHHAHVVGLRYLPFAPSVDPEAHLRQLVLEVP